MQSTSSLPFLPGPIWPGVAVPSKVPTISQVKQFNPLLDLKLFNCVQIKLLLLANNT